VRLYWRVKNRAAVLSVFRGLRCVWEDGDWAGRWIWLYDDEASSVPLPKRPDEVPEIYRPIVLAQISFPAADKMIMRFRAVERAIAATLFFAPRFGQNAVPDRFRILNRLVTARRSSGRRTTATCCSTRTSPSSIPRSRSGGGMRFSTPPRRQGEATPLRAGRESPARARCARS